jgi:hypothetical protein
MTDDKRPTTNKPDEQRPALALATATTSTKRSASRARRSGGRSGGRSTDVVLRAVHALRLLRAN